MLSTLLFCALALGTSCEKAVFLGDSITENGQYLAHLQLFSALRHPGKGIECYNVGKSGDTSDGGVRRWPTQGKGFQPGKVFVMFGMNDSRRDTLLTPMPTNEADAVWRADIVSSYRRNMDELLELIRKDCLDVTVLTPTPYDQYGSQKATAYMGCNEPMLMDFAGIIRELAREKRMKVVDLHGTMTELLKTHPKSGLIGDDRVHPTEVGQYLMACLMLAEMGEDCIVDETLVDADGRRSFSFDYEPKALPIPVTDAYRKVEDVWPVTERLNCEMLKVVNLPQGNYVLKTDGRMIGRFDQKRLEAGINLALLDTPNSRASEDAEKARARLCKIVSDFRSVVYLVEWMRDENVSFQDCKGLKAFFERQREKSKSLSWGNWHRHCIEKLEKMIPKWKELHDEEDRLRGQIRGIRPVASRFLLEQDGVDLPVSVWKLPLQSTTNGFCQVAVDGTVLDVFALPKPQKVLDFQRDSDLNPYGAVFFDADKTVHVDVKFPDGHKESFDARPPFTRVIENGGRHGALVVCANRLETDIPSRHDPKVKWFGPGLHRMDEIRLVSGDTLYLAPGAVVEAPVIAEGRNIKVCGRGILSGIPWSWAKGPAKYCWTFRGERIDIRDVAFAGAWYWSIVLDLAKDVTVDGIRILGGKVLNDDGIDVCRSENVTIRHAFIRTQDDCIAPKWWCRNLLVDDCTLWTDYANIVRVGWECDAQGGRFENLVFRDLDMLHLSVEKRPASHEWFNSAISLQSSAKSTLRDISFEDVRLKSYELGDILFVAYSGDCGPYKGGGKIDRVVLRKITTPPKAEFITRLSAAEPGQIGMVSFEDVQGWNEPELFNATGVVVRSAASYRGLKDGKPLFSRRLGMFVHWGIYSVGGFHEQDMWMKDKTRPEYGKYLNGFTAEKFDADRFVDLAESAGATYIVITTKHHDGFCMWDTATTDFCAPKSPAKRDLIGELAAACHRRGMGIGFYYSNPDWHCPFSHNPKSTHQLKLQPGDAPDLERYIDYEKSQIRELLTKYGEICCWFWDIPTGIERPEMDELVRSLQPNILINDRGWEKGYHIGGDYGTPERDFSQGGGFTNFVEACNSVGRQSWGYRWNEDYHTIGSLVRGIDGFLSCGGNYLLNVGPKCDGTVPEEASVRMRAVGDWLRRVGESFADVESAQQQVKEIRGSRFEFIKDHDEKVDYILTKKGNVLYVHFPKGLHETGVDLAPLSILPQRAIVLNTGGEVRASIEMMPSNRFVYDKPSLHIWEIPSDMLSNECVVLKLEFDGPLD